MRKGIDIGGSFIKVVWEDGKREKVFIKDLASRKEDLLKKLREVVLLGNPEKVGIAVAGYTSLEGKVHRSPNIPTLDGLDLKAFLKDLGMEGVVVNDVSAGAYGLWYYHYRHAKNLVFVAIGTGLGAGLVVEGKPYLGSCGSALELGHHIVERGGKPCSCGRRGCWEAYCSSYGLERIYYEICGERLKDYQIVEKARGGVKEALKALEIFQEYLITGLLNTVHIFNPDFVVLGGGLIDGIRPFLESLEKRLKESVESLPASCMSLTFAPCQEFCMAMGALALTYRDDI